MSILQIKCTSCARYDQCEMKGTVDPENCSKFGQEFEDVDEFNDIMNN